MKRKYFWVLLSSLVAVFVFGLAVVSLVNKSGKLNVEFSTPGPFQPANKPLEDIRKIEKSAIDVLRNRDDLFSSFHMKTKVVTSFDAEYLKKLNENTPTSSDVTDSEGHYVVDYQDGTYGLQCAVYALPENEQSEFYVCKYDGEKTKVYNALDRLGLIQTGEAAQYSGVFELIYEAMLIRQNTVPFPELAENGKLSYAGEQALDGLQCKVFEMPYRGVNVRLWLNGNVLLRKELTSSAKSNVGSIYEVTESTDEGFPLKGKTAVYELVDGKSNYFHLIEWEVLDYEQKTDVAAIPDPVFPIDTRVTDLTEGHTVYYIGGFINEKQ